MIEEPEYNTNIEKVCGEGIHFFMTKEAAKFHALGLMEFVDYTGEFMEWCDKGACLAHGWFKDGKKDGEWENRHDNGQREAHGWYKDGKWDGEWEWCDENGKRWQHVWYEDGKLDGEWEWCDENENGNGVMRMRMGMV